MADTDGGIRDQLPDNGVPINDLGVLVDPTSTLPVARKDGVQVQHTPARPSTPQISIGTAVYPLVSDSPHPVSPWQPIAHRSPFPRSPLLCRRHLN